eukprot:scaffold41044_cov68-Attheya_sp.AAC.1
MPFGPRNAPAFYTARMRQFQAEWTTIYRLEQGIVDTASGPASESSVLRDGTLTVVHAGTTAGSRVIIDDILLWSTSEDACILMFECVCKVFQKYRVSFHLSKCDFLKSSIEYVGHNMTADACGRLSIIQNKSSYGVHTSTGCATVRFIKEVLVYNGDIHVIRRWAQELLGCHFSVIHRPARMMGDVDAFSRRFGTLICAHMLLASTLATQDRQNRPD